MSERSGLLDRALGGFIWSFLGAGGQTIVNALVVVVLARLLTPSEFGIVGAAMVVVNFAQIFTNLGVGPALVQLSALTRTHVHVGFGISVVLGVLFGGTVYLAAGAIGEFFNMPELVPVVRVMAVIFPISGATSVGLALFQRGLQFRPLALIDLLSFGIGYGLVAICLALLGYGVWALVAGQIGQVSLRALIVLTLRRQDVGFAWAVPEARRLLNFGTGFSLARIANYLANQADNLVVGRYVGASALGLYSRAYQFMMLPTNLIGTVLDKVMFPALAAVQGDHTRLGSAFQNALGIVTMVTMPMAAVLYVTAPDLVLLVLGEQWLEVIAPFQILIVVLVFRVAYKISDSLARATGAVYRRAWRQWVYALAVLMGAYFGQLVAGLTGVAFGVALAVVLNYSLMLQLSITLTGVRPIQVLSSLARHALVALLIGALTEFVRKAGSPMWGHPAVSFAAALVFSVGAWLAIWLWLPSTLGPEAAASKRYAGRVLALVSRRVRR